MSSLFGVVDLDGAPVLVEHLEAMARALPCVGTTVGGIPAKPIKRRADAEG